MPKSPEKFRAFKILVEFERPPENPIPLMGFLFNCRGFLLQKQYVKNNVLEFNMENATTSNQNREMDPAQFRLFIAPAFDDKVQRISTVAQMESYKAYEAIITRDPNFNFTILPIPEGLSKFWWKCKCRVRGKISKWFQVGSTWEDRPVCRARVHICEIDPIWYWIYRIPDHVISKIPDLVLNPKVKFPIPIPDPSPVFENRRFVNHQIQAPENIFKTFSLTERREEVMAKLPELGTEIRQNFASGNLDVIRDTIANNYMLLHPWFCLWPWWWPYFYRCQELAVVETNASGYFDQKVSYQCFGDKPDIYIWVEYMINGVWTTVYEPTKPCHTHWNYVCGTPINIHLTDPMVAGNCCCDCHLPGELVWLRSVGNTSVSHINQSNYNQAPPSQSVQYNRIGLTDAAAINDSFLETSVNDYKRPFGGSPSLYMGFGTSLPNSGMYYYRWSYRQRANADLVSVGDSYKPLPPIDGEIRKSYEYVYIDSNGDEQIAPNSVRLGPNLTTENDHLYIIPPEHPTMDPFNIPATSHPIWKEETYSMCTMQFDSTKFPGDGLYELKLELFDKTGKLLDHLPRAVFKTPNHDDPGYSENAPDSLLENPLATTADAFNMLIRIDNGKCDADVFTVNINGNPAASDCCGFVSYGSDSNLVADLELSFLATHPNDFAVFNFGVVKGSCGSVIAANAEGMVIDSASGYTLSGGVYSKHFTPAELLEGCFNNGSGKAAFAETLYVISMATDGTFRVARDDGKVVAFALEP